MHHGCPKQLRLVYKPHGEKGRRNYARGYRWQDFSTTGGLRKHERKHTSCQHGARPDAMTSLSVGSHKSRRSWVRRIRPGAPNSSQSAVEKNPDARDFKGLEDERACLQGLTEGRRWDAGFDAELSWPSRLRAPQQQF